MDFIIAPLEPQLAPPGAGLPSAKLRVARVLFAVRRWTGNRETFTARFESERRAIRQLPKSCDTGSAVPRVLIDRLRGLEESSRYWSVWMTLDHLRIVNRQFGKVIECKFNGFFKRFIQ